MGRKIFLLLLAGFFIFSNLSVAQTNPIDNLTCKDIRVSNDREEFLGKDIYGVLYKCSVDNATLAEDQIRHAFSDVKTIEDRLIAKRIQKDQTIWVKLIKDDREVRILKQTTIQPGSSLKLKVRKQNERVYFYCNHPNGRYLAPMIDMPKGSEVSFQIYTTLRNGKLKTVVNYNRSLEAQYTNNFLLLDYPQAAGMYLCSIEVESEKMPAEIGFSLKDLSSLPKLNNSDKLGGILLKNIPYGSAKVSPEIGEDIYHPSFTESDLIGDSTPSGDAVFWLPSGLWQLDVDPVTSGQTNIKNLKAHFIPTYGGYMTVVNWPEQLLKLFEEPNSLKLSIIGKKIGKDRGSVDITLLNYKDNSTLNKSNFSIYESGIEGKVLSVERIKSPPDVVILLDSSGSMRRSMRRAKASTAEFIKGLPKNSKVWLIEFNSTVKILSNTDKRSALKSLKKVRARGATALYDAILTGLEILSRSNRPTLIVFTDGKDSNYNDTKRQSKATQEQLMEAIKNSNVPIFTIGFGKSPDVSLLSRIASLTKAQFYPARDPKALEMVFRSINENLGHQWRVEFLRPTSKGPSIKPVIAMMIDNSGSMEEEIEQIRQILAGFVKELPEGFLVQLFTFSNSVDVRQVLTTDKASLLRGISQMKALSGTNTILAVKEAYRFLHSIPSKNRYLIYLTDEAIEVEDDERAKFETYLKKLKDDGVKSIWIGMVDKDKTKPFERVSKLSDGTYIIAPTPEKIKESLIELSRQLKDIKSSDVHLLKVVYKNTDRYGRVKMAYDSILINNKLNVNTKDSKTLEGITFKKGEKLKPYSGEISKFLSGDDIINRQVKIIKRIPLNVSSSNKAVRITVKEAVFLDKLRGVEAPSGKRFMALIVQFRNILKPQEVVVYPNGSSHPASWVAQTSSANARIEKKIPDYLIPNAKLHLFLRWNNRQSFPVSDATYLAQTPLILPGENEIYIRPNKTVEGALIFVVPNEFMKQSSLHLYDVAYGHIDIPISGIIKITKEEIEKLPKEKPKKLSDTFSIKIEGFKDKKKISTLEADDNELFRVIHATLISKIQAHLSLDPSKRFYLAISTPKGDFFFKMHPITNRIPYGFYKSQLITPGSFNAVSMVFEIPKVLKDNPAKLVIDLKGSPVEIPIIKGSMNSKKPIAVSKAKGIELLINGLYTAQSDDYIKEGSLIVDLTLKDKLDNYSTMVEDFLALKLNKEARLKFKNLSLKNESAVIMGKGLANFGYNRAKLILGDVNIDYQYNYTTTIRPKLVVLNGQSRRVLAIFNLPKPTKPQNFILFSDIFKDLNLSITTTKPFKEYGLLVKEDVYEEDSDFKEKLDEAISRLTQIRLASGFVKPGSIEAPQASLDGSNPKGFNIPTPSIVSWGAKRWSRIKTLDDLKRTVSGMELKPSELRAWEVVYSKEASLTQNWITQNGIAYMTEALLNSMGYSSKRLTVSLSEKGKEQIKEFFKGYDTDIFELPAISYQDDKGVNHTLVLPFFKETWQMRNAIESIEEADYSYPQASIEVSITALPTTSSAIKAFTDMGNALVEGENETTETITLINKKLPLKDLSMGFLDIGFVQTMDSGKGRIIKAILDGVCGRYVSEESLELSKYIPLSVNITIYSNSEKYTTTRWLKKGQWPTDLFFVLAVNSPSMTREALKYTNQQWMDRYKRSKDPNTISSLRWLGRGIITRFIGAQSLFEDSLSKKLNLKIKRTTSTRVIVVSFRVTKDSKSPTTSLDLVNVYPQIEADDHSKRAFNIISGIYYTNLEKFANPGGFNVFDLWSLLPNDTKIMLLSPQDAEDLAEELKRQNYPGWMIKHIKDTQNYLLFPSKPLNMDGYLKTAWLEIDPQTYRVYSYFDTGERGSITESAVINENVAAMVDYMVGFWMGVQTSVWSVASFSLELDNWEDIKTQAHAFARMLGDYLQAVLESKERLSSMDWQKLQKIAQGKYAEAYGIEKAQYGGFDKNKLAEDIKKDAQSRGWQSSDIQDILKKGNLKDMAKETEGKFRSKYGGFVNGFKDGVEFYFK
ncbi:vWA domain-containing protein [Hippea sp. KM1]|uniref:vWA domain-containing protein n=1 Tax=Hippea sp. KM1 TaxID=944481 RepID=UPI00046CEB0D|nr:VWA domain-containing protein [Hippea sp. KM1]